MKEIKTVKIALCKKKKLIKWFHLEQHYSGPIFREWQRHNH